MDLRKKIVIAFTALSVGIAPLTSSYAQSYQISQAPDAAAKNEEVAYHAAENAKDWAESHEQDVQPILELASELEKHTQDLEARFGNAKIEEMLLRGDIVIERAGLGKADMKLIDGVRVPRVVLESNSNAYLLLDSAKIETTSSHLRQYVARVHMDSGKTGRNLSLLWFESYDLTQLREIHAVESLPKPKAMSMLWWKEYFYSKYKKPTLNDVSMALAVGTGMQATLATVVSLVKSHVFGTPMAWEPTIWTAFFGLGIGTFNSTYKNWVVNSGNKLTRVLKGQTVSSMFALGLILLTSDGGFGQRLSRINIMSSEGLLLHTSVLANGLMNNSVKDFWSRITSLRDKARQNVGTIDFKVLGQEIKWNRSNLESQMLYLVPWTINLISLLTLSAGGFGTIGDTGITIPILPLLSTPLAMAITKWYARKLANKVKDDPLMQVRAAELEKMASQYETQWDTTFGRLERGVLKLKASFQRGCKSLFGKVF